MQRSASSPDVPCTASDFLNFLEQMQGRIHCLALRFSDLADIEDSEQEARLALWREWPLIRVKREPLPYANRVARHAMYRAIFDHHGERREQAESLQVHLSHRGLDFETGYETDIPDNTTRWAGNPAQRRRVLAALAQLKEYPRFAVMARFRIEDSQGEVPDEPTLTRELRTARGNGLRRLRQLLEVPSC